MKANLFKAPSGASIGITQLGFGTAPFGNLYHAVSEKQAEATLEAAWAAGIRYYDTAPLYGLGLAETRLNHFLRGKPRQSYVVSTKVGRLLRVCPPAERTGIGKFFDTPCRSEVYDYGYDGVMRSLEHSLERLGLDQVEILFVHDIDVFNHRTLPARDAHVETFMQGGYRALVKLRDAGVIKAFGAGINEWEVAETLARRGDFDIFLLAGRYTLLEQEALASFLPLCVSRGIGIVLGGPFNSGILASGPVPGANYNYEPAPPAILDRVAAIQRVCEAHGTVLVEAALRFPLLHSAVVSVIPGASSPEEVAGNQRALTKAIPAKLWQELKAQGLLRSDAPVAA
ncbi:MAG: aldo/keto reductase [Pseudomonadota bacterium]|nr:aldo/keto reductase [Pseudomonadota bacterium]